MFTDPAEFSFHGKHIPEGMHQPIKEYLRDRVLNDEFLKAIVCNDLRATLQTADNTNLWLLPVYVAYFYNEAPSQAWGSRRKVAEWLEPQEVRVE